MLKFVLTTAMVITGLDILVYLYNFTSEMSVRESQFDLYIDVDRIKKGK